MRSLLKRFRKGFESICTKFLEVATFDFHKVSPNFFASFEFGYIKLQPPKLQLLR